MSGWGDHAVRELKLTTKVQPNSGSHILDSSLAIAHLDAIEHSRMAHFPVQYVHCNVTPGHLEGRDGLQKVPEGVWHTSWHGNQGTEVGDNTELSHQF